MSDTVNIRKMTNEDLLERYAETYGRLKFDLNNAAVQINLENIVNELFSRMKKENSQNWDIKQLLTDDDYVEDETYDINPIIDRLIKDMRLNIKDMGSTVHKKDESAHIISIIDSSSSMGEWERYMSKCFLFWMNGILHKRYPIIFRQYMQHTNVAKFVNKDDFFKSGIMGGTFVSSAYKLLNEKLIDMDYKNKNIFVFHFSDGDNLKSDNATCENYLEEIKRKVKLFGYVELNQYKRTSTLMPVFNKINDKNIRNTVINDRSELLQALKNVLQPY